MKGVRSYWWSLAILIILGSSARAGDVVNGYTYIAPSIYPAPPVVLYDPAFNIPVPTVIQPLSYTVPAPVVYAQPAFVSQTVMPYNPTWAYAPVMVGPTAVRARANYSRNGLEYRYREYAPGRLLPVYSYKVDSEPYGVKIRERVR